MSDIAGLFVDSRCTLGEGPLWHPDRNELFWFDILERTLFRADADGAVLQRYLFEDFASAAAIIDAGTLAIATGDGIERVDIASGHRARMIGFEQDRPENRPNDGRVGPTGAWWLGTMNRRGEAVPATGALYHFFLGRLHKLLEPIQIPNSICFSPDGALAYCADTPTRTIRRIALDTRTGLPAGSWEVFADLSEQRGAPDGAVTDSEGYVWSARWGGGCVVRHAPNGSIDRVIEVPASNVTCPAFGGADLKTLFITTAREGLTAKELAREPHAGGVFSIRVDVPGLPETRLKL